MVISETLARKERAKYREPLILLSHPTGNQNVRNAVRSLSERELLAEFWTTIAWDSTSVFGSLLPSRVRAQMERRLFSDADRDKIHCVPGREVMRLALSRAPLGRALCSGERPFSVIGMYRHFDATVARRLRTIKPDAVYAYEGGALNTFREAKSLGVTTIYELPSGYWHRENEIFQEDVRCSPEFASLHLGLKDSAEHLRRKDEELALADIVVVPSQFVRRTLHGVLPESKSRIVRYGAPAPRPRPERIGANERLRVLFVGSLIQRKGIGYLLRAIQELKHGIDLTLIGQRLASNEFVDKECSKHRRLESLPHSEVLEIMMQCDVLVLPSLSDAFGLVVTEALACGLSVIVTPNVGACDLVVDGSNGFVVPVGSASAIAEKLALLQSDRGLLRTMSNQAQQTAEANGWGFYREKLADVVRTASCK